jgi:hypothetical protein
MYDARKSIKEHYAIHSVQVYACFLLSVEVPLPPHGSPLRKMASNTHGLPRRCIAVLQACQAFLNILTANNNFCVICRNQFEVANFIAVFGCCRLYYHIECAAKWLNYPILRSHHHNHNNNNTTSFQPRYVTCGPCTARWDQRRFNSYFPANQFEERLERLASGRKVSMVPAGIPPANAPLVDAAINYGRHGLSVLLDEMMGRGAEPMNEEDAQRLLDTLIERIRLNVGIDRWANHHF